jgi:hypothetical protein
VFNLDPQYIKAVAAEREREARETRLVRQAQAQSEDRTTRGGRRWRIRTRGPLKA